MHLSNEQITRYFRIFDDLALYANDRLHVIPDPERTPSNNLYAEDEGAICQQLWEHLELVEEFCNANPTELPEADIAVARGWKDSLVAFFYVKVLDNGNAYFLYDRYVFEVTCVNKELSALMHGREGYAMTGLLPFEDAIVGSPILMRVRPPYELGIIETSRGWLAESLEEGKIIQTAEEYARVAPEAKAIQQFKAENGLVYYPSTPGEHSHRNRASRRAQIRSHARR